MSRIVSGKTDAKDIYKQFLNLVRTKDDLTNGKNGGREYGDFHAQVSTLTDELQVLKPFSMFKDLFLYSATDSPNLVDQKLIDRVERYFPNGKSFLESARVAADSNRFWVDGVVFVNGDLDLSEGITATDIRDGVIVVNGNLTLGSPP